MNQRHFFSVDLFDHLKIKSFQVLAGAHIKSRSKDFIKSFVKLVARLLSLAACKIQLALGEVIVRALDDLINTRIGHSNFSRGVKSRRSTWYLSVGYRRECESEYYDYGESVDVHSAD